MNGIRNVLKCFPESWSEQSGIEIAFLWIYLNLFQKFHAIAMSKNRNMFQNFVCVQQLRFYLESCNERNGALFNLPHGRQGPSQGPLCHKSNCVVEIAVSM